MKLNSLHRDGAPCEYCSPFAKPGEAKAGQMMSLVRLRFRIWDKPLWVCLDCFLRHGATRPGEEPLDLVIWPEKTESQKGQQ